MKLTKSICIMPRRPDMSRADFQRYYESNHAPLGIRHFPFRRYVRNHLVDAPDIGFDTISEFWAEDIQALAARMDGPIGDIMRADEQKFVDKPRIAPAGSDEHVLSEGAPAGEGGQRFALLVGWEGGQPPALMDWARGIATRLPGVSIDLTTSWREPPFPARAVLWSPERVTADVPAGLSTRTIEVRRVETPVELLAHAGEG